MTNLEAYQKATYLFYHKLKGSVPYEELINKVSIYRCGREYRNRGPEWVALIILKTKKQFASATYSEKRLKKLTLPKKYHSVKRTKPVFDSFYAEYSYKDNTGEIRHGRVTYESKVTKEDIIKNYHLNESSWYEVKLFTRAEQTKKFLAQEF